MRFILYLILLLISTLAQAQNLIVNPGAELDPTTNGWTNVLGLWIRGTEVTPHGGSYHFYAGNDSPDGSELYQDVDVSAYAANIDIGASTFNFSAWLRIYNFSSGSWNDQARLILEYRDGTGTILSTYDTGLRSNSGWTQYSDSRVAPAGTRTIRVRLYATKLRGSEADGYFDDLVLTQTTTLPVTLISFTSTAEENTILVEWQTSTEESNNYFTLERSTNGTDWNVISVQEGTNFSNQLQTYRYLDQNLSANVYYYRLQQTDLDGQTNSYPVIEQNILSSTDFILYPNPAAGSTTIQTSNQGNKAIKVYSTDGRLLVNIDSFSGFEYSLHLDTLPAGQYIIEVITDATATRKVLVKN